MLVIDIADFSKDVARVFDTALTDDVIVSDKNGVSYKILPIKNVAPKGKSPFEDVPCICANITTREIVELIRENRAGT